MGRWEIQVEPDDGAPESRRLKSFDFALENKSLRKRAAKSKYYSI